MGNQINMKITCLFTIFFFLLDHGTLISQNKLEAMPETFNMYTNHWNPGENPDSTIYYTNGKVLFERIAQDDIFERVEYYSSGNIKAIWEVTEIQMVDTIYDFDVSAIKTVPIISTVEVKNGICSGYANSKSNHILYKGSYSNESKTGTWDFYKYEEDKPKRLIRIVYKNDLPLNSFQEFQIDENLCIVESSHIGECVTKLDTFIDACADKIMIIPAYYLKH